MKKSYENHINHIKSYENHLQFLSATTLGAQGRDGFSHGFLVPGGPGPPGIGPGIGILNVFQGPYPPFPRGCFLSRSLFGGYFFACCW